jgi:multidrug efflux pump subunit AcrB
MAICIVFVPILFLSGAAGSLFKPLALAVVYAMIASFILSRTYVPVMCKLLLGKEAHLHAHGHEAGAAEGDIIWRIHQRFNRYFDMFLGWYRQKLFSALHHRPLVLALYGLLFAGSACLLPFIGQDFFPTVDAGQFRLHVRAPAGTRIEETERIFARVERAVRKSIPADELDLILDNIGLPVGGVNFAYNTTGSIGPSDGEILVTLKEGHHGPTADLIARLRHRLPQQFPQLTFFFQPADITSQILNFGLPAPIDLQVTGTSPDNYRIAEALAARVWRVAGAADVHVHQVVDMPELRVNVDRERAEAFGLTQRDIANNLLISLSSSGQTFPNFWLDPKNGVSYLVAVQTPQYNLDTIDELQDTPVESNTGQEVQSGTGSAPEMLSNVAQLQRRTTAEVINHYNVQPTFDIYANVQDRDLGGVSRDINAIIRQMTPHLPKGTSLVMRGQVQSMNDSFIGLGFGLIFSIIFIYMLLVVNFQSLIDPLIIITALPGALCGIVWMLFVTHTDFSVPALMGAIMCIGVSTANSILVLTFANDRLAEGDTPMTAAMAAGCTRLRPVLMTAAAMILGMLPMALGLGEGGEQNAPLGRAVIGGLLVATASTLLFVPLIYSMLRKPLAQSEAFDAPETGRPGSIAGDTPAP